MTGILLLIPFFLIRFVLLFLINKNSIKRAAHFAPLKNREIVAYWIYQFSNLAIFASLFFLNVQDAPPTIFCVGTIIYVVGIVVLTMSVVNFAKPSESGINKNGLYQLSRNPMYVAYFLFFMGCVLLTQSLLLLALVLVFQITAHFIILSEERWCIQEFGSEYEEYMHKVRRYI